VAAAVEPAAHLTPRRAGLAVTCAALAVGALALNRQLVGVFYDDGLYAGIAVALAQGMGYVHPHLPGAPAAVHYPPLWPVLLTPLFAVFRLDAAALLGKTLNLLLAAAGAGLIAWHAARTRLLGDDAPPWLAPVLVGAAAITIPVLAIQAVLFSEPLFGVLLVAAVILTDAPPSRLPPGVAAGLAGCAAAPSRDDPFEPWNRAMYEVHQVVDGNVVKPIAEAYVKAMPELIRTGVSNFFGNIDDLFTGINNVLEGRGAQAGDDFGRVLLNSTFGMAGILDLASMVGINKDKKDFGITFGKWGAPQGPYFFVPLFGPTTLRDGTGTVVRYWLSPVGHIPDIAVRNSLYGIGYVDARAQALSAESVLDTAALDRYRFLRNSYLKNRRYQVYDGKPPPEEDEDAPAPGAVPNPVPSTPIK